MKYSLENVIPWNLNVNFLPLQFYSWKEVFPRLTLGKILKMINKWDQFLSQHKGMWPKMRRHQGQLNNNTSLLSYKRADNRSPFSLNTPFIYQIRRFTPLLVEETGNVPLRLVTNPMKPVWPRRSSGRDDKMLIFSWTFVHYQDDDSLTRTSPRCLV